MFSNRHELRTIDIRRSSVRPLISNLRDATLVDFYHRKGRVWLFWTDLADDAIYTGLMSGDQLTNIQRLVTSGLASVEGLAVDWVGENLYWIEAELGQIEVASLNGFLRQTLMAGDMSRPRGLALDPHEAIMFWTDWGDISGSPRIESCSMDGALGNRRTVIDASRHGGFWPSSLTIDYLARRLYWTDTKTASVHTALYDGSGHHVVIRGHPRLSHPFSLAVFESHIYWTDRRSSSIVQANKWNGSDVRIIEKTISPPYGMKVVHPSMQVDEEKKHPCQIDNGKCSHLCLLGLNQTF